ncbi:early nodulin-like protein 8 [Musa acuminata AAA Group]|uniref:early nodulin-like protein 8 n=1 Tax=Musa acuminata AAA Group TaxID=214697 RepID=UPI0031D9EFE5
MHPFCFLHRGASFRIVLAAALLLLLGPQNGCWCYEYKVGDLDCWGVPPPSNPLLYSAWSQNHHFRLGDSLLFLYPPSQDSVIQVTERAFNSCSLGEPVLNLDDGNSLFNLTVPGYYYFTSGVADHCKKNQKLVVAVPSANGTFFPPPAFDSTAPPAESQSYPIVFGPTPAQGSSGTQAAVVEVSTAVGSVAAAVVFLGFTLM